MSPTVCVCVCVWAALAGDGLPFGGGAGERRQVERTFRNIYTVRYRRRRGTERMPPTHAATQPLTQTPAKSPPAGSGSAAQPAPRGGPASRRAGRFRACVAVCARVQLGGPVPLKVPAACGGGGGGGSSSSSSRINSIERLAAAAAAGLTTSQQRRRERGEKTHDGHHPAVPAPQRFSAAASTAGGRPPLPPCRRTAAASVPALDAVASGRSLDCCAMAAPLQWAALSISGFDSDKALRPSAEGGRRKHARPTVTSCCCFQRVCRLRASERLRPLSSPTL